MNSLKMSNMSGERRGSVISWAKQRIEIEHESPARDAAIMLLDLVNACVEVSEAGTEEHWLQEICYSALYGPLEEGRER